MKKLMYDVKAIQMLRLQEEFIKQQHTGTPINEDYFYFHNNICPRCQKSIRVVNNSIKNIGSISGFYSSSRNEIIMYACCKECGRELTTKSRFGTTLIHSKDKDTDGYIVGVLNESR